MSGVYREYREGNILELRFQCKRSNEALVDPESIVVTVMKPDTTSEAYTYPDDIEIIREYRGRFLVEIPLDQPGYWYYTIETSGTYNGATQQRIHVLPLENA